MGTDPPNKNEGNHKDQEDSVDLGNEKAATRGTAVTCFVVPLR